MIGRDPSIRDQVLPFSRRVFASELPKRSHVKRETGEENGNPRGGASVSLFATRVSSKPKNKKAKE
jgi:hypothetical protein